MPAAVAGAQKTTPQSFISKGPSPSSNVFEKLEGVDTAEEVTRKPEGKWELGSKLTADQKKVEEVKKETPVYEKPK